jgi:hypothetical protein
MVAHLGGVAAGNSARVASLKYTRQTPFLPATTSKCRSPFIRTMPP